jgi:hypothetical protein
MSKKSKVPNYSDYEWDDLSDMILTGLECLPGRPRSRSRAEAIHQAYAEKLIQGVSTTVTSACVHFREARDLMESSEGPWRIRLNFEFEGVQLIANFSAGDPEEIPWRPDETGATAWGKQAND